MNSFYKMSVYKVRTKLHKLQSDLSMLKKFENIAATKCMCLSEERLTELIKSIFKEEFEIQQKNIVTLISGNFEIIMQEIK